MLEELGNSPDPPKLQGFGSVSFPIQKENVISKQLTEKIYFPKNMISGHPVVFRSLFSAIWSFAPIAQASNLTVRKLELLVWVNSSFLSNLF